VRHYVARLEGPTMVVSDIHCPLGRCGVAREVVRVAVARGAATLAVLGDLFDDFRKLVTADELRRALAAAFGPLGGVRVVYVTSGSSHDPILDRALRLQVGGSSFEVYPGGLVARVDGVTAFMTHGDAAMRNGAHAFLANAAMRLLGRGLFLERRLRERLRLPPHWWLFMGHTHIPGIDYRARVANPGSWREEWFRGLPYWRPPSRTYLWVESGLVELREKHERFLR